MTSAPPPPAASPSPPTPARIWWALAGALLVVPALLAGLVGLATAGLDCGDDDGALAMVVMAAVASAAAPVWWAWWCGLRRWALAGVGVSGALVSAFVSAVVWLTVAFDKCFTF